MYEKLELYSSLRLWRAKSTLVKANRKMTARIQWLNSIECFTLAEEPQRAIRVNEGHIIRINNELQRRRNL